MKLEPHRQYLEEIVIPVRLACRTGRGWPFIVSLWYIYEEGTLYCATQAGAKIVRYLQHDPRCAFEIASDLPPYCGIRGQAEAEILPRLGESILARLLVRYLGGTASPLAQNLLKNSASEVAIRLRSISVYEWNFTDRMHDSLTASAEKPCPDITESRS